MRNLGSNLLLAFLIGATLYAASLAGDIAGQAMARPINAATSAAQPR